MAAYIGNIRKMRVEHANPVNYTLPLYDVLEKGEMVPMNDLIGKEIVIKFENQINCVVTGKKINKTFGEGMSFDAWKSSPMAVESIIRPELSQIHEGIALRDFEWEKEHHLQPHVTYLSLTAGIKVGVTREIQVPARWIDQGATQAILLAKTPYRQAAGLIEVALKDFIADKTNWRNMLKNVFTNDIGLIETKTDLVKHIPFELQEFLTSDNNVTEIIYPVLRYPEKIKSINLNKVPLIEKKLMGIKGQYLIFDDDTVINLRSHSGYRISLSA